MIFSKKELSKYVDLENISNEKLKEAFENLAYEVEQIIQVNSAKDIKFGKVISCETHPNADRLKLCSVKTDGKIYDVVCGGKNIAQGQIVAHALPNSVVKGIKLEKRKIREIDSYGMVLSISELGGFSNEIVEQSEQGNIFVFDKLENNSINPIEVLGFNDELFDLSILPDRIYASSYKQMAQELGAYLGRKLKNLECPINPIELSKDEDNEIKITLSENVARVTAFHAKLGRNGNTPWFVKRLLYLHNIEVKNTLEDLINYVKLYKGSTAYVLNKTNRVDLIGKYLNKKNIFKNSPLLNSKSNVTFVSIATKEKLNPVERKELYYPYGELNSRGTSYVDCKLGTLIKLATKYGYVEAVGKKTTVENPNYQDKLIRLNEKTLYDFVGQKFSLKKIKEQLMILGIVEVKKDVWKVPKTRIDLTNKQELIEEIIRFLGMEKIEAQQLKISDNFSFQEKHRVAHKKITNHLVKYGFYDVNVYQLISEHDAIAYNIWNTDSKNFVQLLSQYNNKQNTMQTSLIKNLINTHVLNYRKNKTDLRFFTLSNLFWNDSTYTYNLGLIHDSNLNKDEPVLGTKRLLFDILKLFKIDPSELKFTETIHKDSNIFHPYNSAEVFYKNKKIALIGELHPKVLRDHKYIRIDKIKEKLYYFELILDQII